MKAITLHQPWATYMAVGLKMIETRSWPTTHRGWLAIHAGKNEESLYLTDMYARAACLEAPDSPTVRALRPLPDPLPLGAIVAVGCLKEVRTTEALELEVLGTDRPLGNYEPGRYGWVFSEIIQCEPIPCRGYQQLWGVPEPIAEQLRHLIADRQQERAQ